MFKSVFNRCATVSGFYLRSFYTKPTYRKSFKQIYQNLWVHKSPQPPYLHVTQIGDPVLRKKAYAVPGNELQSNEVKLIIDNMINVLRNFDCVGLAAPQIGISLQIIVMEFKEELKNIFSSAIYEARQMETMGLSVFINPSLKVTNFNKRTFQEGCASVRGYSADVDRYEEVTLTGFDENGKEQTKVLRGWNARIAQHEMDHLNGQIFTDIMNPTTFNCTCWQQVNSKCGRIEIPFYPKK